MHREAMPHQLVPVSVASDERREWLRIDDNLLLEYRLLDESSDAPSPMSAVRAAYHPAHKRRMRGAPRRLSVLAAKPIT